MKTRTIVHPKFSPVPRLSVIPAGTGPWCRGEEPKCVPGRWRWAAMPGSGHGPPRPETPSTTPLTSCCGAGSPRGLFPRSWESQPSYLTSLKVEDEKRPHRTIGCSSFPASHQAWRQECPPTFSREESSRHQYLIFTVTILLCAANTLFHFNLVERYKSCRFLYSVTCAASWLHSTASGTWAQVQGGSESMGEELGCVACPCFC